MLRSVLVVVFAAILVLAIMSSTTSAASLTIPLRGNWQIVGFHAGQGDHQGVDLYATDLNSNDNRVYPSAGGVVAYVGFDCSKVGYSGLPCNQVPEPYYGNTVVVDHGDGTYTRYVHLATSGLPAQGQHVSTSTVIGYVSNSGCGACGVHLHFGAYTGPAGLTGRAALWNNSFAPLNIWGVIPGLPAEGPQVSNPGPTYPPQTVSLPRAPSNVRATANGVSQIVVTWTDNSNNENGFQVVDCVPPGNTSDCTVNQRVGANATSFTLNGLSAGQYKCFAVRSTNFAGDSDWSDPYACTTTQTYSQAGPGLQGAVPPTTAQVLLGDLPNLGAYCAKVHPGTGYNQSAGTCSSQSTANLQVFYPVNWDAACQMQYPNQNAWAKQTKPGDVYSWKCFTGPR